MGDSMDGLVKKRVLITGGTGSFGNAFLKRLLMSPVDEIRIFSRDELKQFEMRERYKDPRITYHVGDIRDRASVNEVMRGVHHVFHAAALKQVPSCEFFPLQAVMTNVLGSENIISCARENAVERVVCLSTDKAVYPINTMGMTKALMEKLASASARLNAASTIVCSVRYGNVMGSRGSVIPVFSRLIQEGKPLKVTAPEMTRFLLPLEEAIGLVVLALERGQPGDLFIRKSPACTVIDLANAMKELYNSNVPIESIGVRHGEKIHETLATFDELSRAEDLGDYYRIPLDERSLDYAPFFTKGETQAPKRDYTSENARRLSVPEVRDLLRSLSDAHAS